MNAYSLRSVKFWQAYLITMRPYLLFISGAAGLVGMAFIPHPTLFKTLVAFIPLFFSYGLGQALTDCFQTDTDAISSPYRPLVRGLISRKNVLIVSLTGLTVGVLLMGYLNPKILILGTGAIIGLLTYTLFKRTWWGGPPWNSWIVALLPIIGRLVDRDYHLRDILAVRNSHAWSFLLAVLAIFFGYANFVVIGYFKDISADRKTGYRTFPVVFGWQSAAVYSDLTALLAAVLTGWAIAISGSLTLGGIAVFVIALAVNTYAQITLHTIRDERKTHGPICNVVRALLFYCLALVVTLKPKWILLTIVFYLIFELSLRFRPEKVQV